MDKVLIVGSGASGVHFALTALQKGVEVHLLDVGHKRPDVSNPEDNLNDLKSNLDDPVRYFLGEAFVKVYVLSTNPNKYESRSPYYLGVSLVDDNDYAREIIVHNLKIEILPFDL